MLFAGRNEVEKFAVSNFISYREDKSNQETKYLRNKIRHKLLPVLEELNRDYRQVFYKKNFNHIREVEKVYKHSIQGIKHKVISEDAFGSKRIAIDDLFLLAPT